jgi:glycosyltransferase involved in cell wall biosynthesis/peptidoglycan/xylan/chitin deacetylase (PgdA/CDA1 family)
MKPIVTVLMTVYNGSNYLNEAIESALCQTLNEFEFLIIDDASTDNSVEIINSYRDSRIKLLRNDKNIGQTASLNLGLDRAQGEYIARFDQDDVCLPRRLEEQVAFLKKNPSTSIVCSREYSIDEKGEKIGAWTRELNNYGAFLAYIILGINPIWTPSVIFVKDDILQLNGFDEYFGPASDFELWSRIALKRLNAQVVPKFHQLRRIHSQSQSNLKTNEQSQANKKALSNVIKYFLDEEDNNDLLSALLLDSFRINKINKANPLIISKKINALIERISLKQNLNKDEVNSLKSVIFQRIGYGFSIAPLISFLPFLLFKIMFYLASPMYLITLKNLLSFVRQKLRSLTKSWHFLSTSSKLSMIEVAFHHKLLIYIQPIFSFIRKVSIKVGFIGSNRLRVLVLHDIPPNQELVLKKQLQELQKKWNIVSPERFEKMISGIEPIQDNNLLITFDDGLISNRIVAEKVLNPLGIKAIFFVVTDFIDIKNVDDAHQFIADNIVPKAKKEEIPMHWYNMQWEDLTALIEQGHTIGSHTKKHTRLSSCNNKDELIEELVISAKYIESKLGEKVEHFAFTFGNIESFSNAAMEVAKSQFSFIYSGVRGNNINNVSPLAIRRDVAAYQLSNNEYRLCDDKLLKTFLDGIADLHYFNARRKLDSWCR